MKDELRFFSVGAFFLYGFRPRQEIIQEFTVAVFSHDTSVTFANSEIFCVIKGAEGQEPIIFDPYILTTSGTELYNIIKIASDFKTYSEYCICCIKELKMKYKNADFTVLRNKGNDMEDVDI